MYMILFFIMKYSTKSKWTKTLVSLAGLALTFNLVACTKDEAGTEPAQSKSTNEENLQNLLTLADPIAVAACTDSKSASDIAPPILKRGLTQNETAFYSKFFENKLDINGVCLHLYEQELSKHDHANETHIIKIFGRGNYSSDYATEQDPDRFGLLAAEMAHLMQHQNGTHTYHTRMTREAEYQKLYGDLDMQNYSDPEKIALIEDYARFVFHPTAQTKQLQKFTDPCVAQNILVETIERVLPGSAEMRRAFQNRYLTANERALVLGIFGDQIAYIHQMTVDQRRECGKDDVAASVAYNSKTQFQAWGTTYHERDYTQGGHFNFGTFVHETTHEWQNQKRHKYTGGRNKEYAYPIDTSQWSFRHYFNEQQGAIMEDYARFFLHYDRDTRYLQRTEENLAGLKKIVEDQFPMAKRTREYFEENKRLPDLKTVMGWLQSQQYSSRRALAAPEPG